MLELINRAVLPTLVAHQRHEAVSIVAHRLAEPPRKPRRQRDHMAFI